MHIVILNWAEGENDPFTFFSQQFEMLLKGLGHAVHVVPLAGPAAATIEAIHAVIRIDLAFAWQGIGSALTPSGRVETVWELLEIPLVSVHGDHPCYNPVNHQQRSRHFLHLYSCKSFLRDANRFIQRDWPAAYVPILNLFVAPRESVEFKGDYFVFPKNYRDVNDTRSDWKARCKPETYRFLSAGADAIEAEFRCGNSVNHPEIIIDLFPSPIPDTVRAGMIDPALSDVIFRFMRELDHVHRNVAAAFVLESLPDVPIRVYGRGWERFAASGNPHHVFQPANQVAQGHTQFHSAFGILDVAPVNDTLHDRTLRAARIGAGFLISSSWARGEEVHDHFADLFFSGNAAELRSKVDVVRSDPDAHRSRVCRFSDALDRQQTATDFVQRVRGLAAQRGFVLPN